MATPISESTSPATFTLFSHLPAELRLKIWQNTLPTSQILKISYSPTHSTYISNTAPPITLSINHESRSQALFSYTHLCLGPIPKPTNTTYHSQFPTPVIPLIPISYPANTLYISSLAPLLQTHLHDLLYNLSTSPSRHHLRYLAFDLRVWPELCDYGLLAVLAKMRAISRVDMVVEFGRSFSGEVGFLEAPEWRCDLRWVADRAGREVGEERVRGLAGVGGRMRGEVGVGEKEGGEEWEGVKVRCVILTRGGEQA